MLPPGNFHYADEQHGNYLSADLSLLPRSLWEENSCHCGYTHIEGFKAVPDSGKFMLFSSHLQE
jgi:hypothetical protein